MDFERISVENSKYRREYYPPESEKKADFIALLYEYFTETGKEVNKETVEKHLRLVA